MQVLLTRLKDVLEKGKLQPGTKLATDEVTSFITAVFGPGALFNPNAVLTDTSGSGGLGITAISNINENNSVLKSEAVFNGSTMKRTRRPQKYKNQKIYKNKPKKHSDEINEEDKEGTKQFHF